MAVVVIPRFDKQQIRKMLLDKKKRIYDAVLLNLKRIGEQFVTSARGNDTYKDRTGNLRSSIGYVIIYNGQQLFESFEVKTGPEGGGDTGVEKAKALINESRQKFTSGFVLICVAGMDYAAAVESLGYDVISAGSIEAEKTLKLAIKRIAAKTGP